MSDLDAMDIVRALFHALNREEMVTLVNVYAPDCVLEHVFVNDDGVVEGRDAVLARWRDEFTRYAGAFAGAHRFAVQRIAGIETGWGWVRAEWTRSLRERATGREIHHAGSSHFWIEHGAIRRHRSVTREMTIASTGGLANVVDATARAGERRRYPARPIVGVGAVVLIDGEGLGDRSASTTQATAPRVVLVKRRFEPLAGQWSLPGGTLELGETLEAGTAREILEETGLIVDVGPVVDVFDRILVDEAGDVRYHFVLVDYLCRPRAGALVAGSDVSDVAVVDPADLASYRVTEKVQSVVAKALDKSHAAVT